MQRSSVVLPEPLGPRIAATSPCSTRRSTPLRTSREPKAFRTFLISSIMGYSSLLV